MAHKFVFLIFLIAAASGLHTFPAFRMLQYKTPTQAFGSQKASLNLAASTVTLTADDLSRNVLILRLEDLQAISLDQIQSQKTGGLLILLPSTQPSEELVQVWHAFEVDLSQRELSIPVYFSFEDDELLALYQDLRSAGGQPSLQHTEPKSLLHRLFTPQDHYVVTSPSGEPSELKDITLRNFQGWLAGSAGTAKERENIPTIAVVAYYDTLGIAPELSNGTDSNGSGVATLLELARLFSKLYSGFRSQGRANLLFLLTGGGRWNYAGARHWLQSTEGRVLESVEAVVCLDTLAGDELFLHVSKPPSDPKVLPLVEAFQQTATEYFPALSLGMVHKKINVSNPTVFWEHEQFSRKKLLAATLSRLPAAIAPSARVDIFDGRDTVDLTKLARNIEYIAESLARLLFKPATNASSPRLFAGSHSVLPAHVDAWLTALAQTPRTAPYFEEKGKPAPLLVAVERALQDYLADASAQSFTLPSDSYTFYGLTRSTLSVYKVKPWSFQLSLTAVIAAYLLGWVLCLQGPLKTLHMVRALFSSTRKRK